MMQLMRKYAKGAMAFVLFGLLIISFAIWGIGDIFRGGSSDPEVATVGETQISVREFNDELQRELKRLESVFGRRLDPAQAREFGIVEQVLSGMISRALIDRAAVDLSLTAGDGLIQKTIFANPAFAGSDGQFSRDAFQRRLYNVGLSEAGYVAAIRGAVMRDQLTGSLTAGAAPPRRLLDDIYAYRRERRGGTVVTVEADSITGIPAPTEAQVAAFHTDNADLFMAPDLRAVTAIILSADEAAKSITVPEEEIRAAYDDRIGDFRTPERRSFEQLLFLDEETATKAAAMLAQGRPFADVGTELAGAPPIPLGPMTRAELTAQAPDLAEAGFALAADATSEPLQSPLGWHILHVVEIEPEVVQPYESVKDQVAAELAQERAIEEIYEISNQVDDALAGGATLEEAAHDLGLPLRTIPAIDTAGRDANGDPIADLPQENGEFTGTVFDTAPGQQSLMVEIGTDRYFVLRVDSETPAALRPLDTVRDRVAEAWRARQRQEAAEKAAQALLAQVRAGGDLAALAAEKGYALRQIEPTVRTADDPSAGASEPVTGTLFTLDPGQAAVTPTAGGYAVVRLDTVRAADPVADAETYTTIRDQLREQIANDIMSQFTQAVREDHPVTINQAAIENFIQ